MVNVNSSLDVKSHPLQCINVPSAMIDSPDNLKVYHQNIRGLKGKISQFSNTINPELPHIIRISKHHLQELEIDTMSTECYKIGDKYCRQQYKNGSVCIYVHESMDYSCIPT